MSLAPGRRNRCKGMDSMQNSNKNLFVFKNAAKLKIHNTLNISILILAYDRALFHFLLSRMQI